MNLPLTSGCAGADVGQLQQLLLEASYGVDKVELEEQTFGLTTLQAVRAFQSRAIFEGQPLIADGIVGPATWHVLTNPPSKQCTAPGWKYYASETRPSIMPVITAAVGEIGVCEIPPHSNRSPRIDVFTAPDTGIAWCAALVSWAYRAATPPSPFGRILSANGIYQWGRSNKRLVQPEEAIPGDVFIILRGKDRDGYTHGHCGICVHRLDDGRLCTVEGNASDAVRGVIRNPKDVTAVVRPIPVL